MPVFFLDLEAIPTSAASCAPEAVGASVLIFVIADSRPEAEARARAAVIDHAWITIDIPLFLQLSDKQLSCLDANLHTAYEQALKYGIGCLFMAYTRDEEPLDDPMEFYAFSAPAFSSKREH